MHNQSSILRIKELGIVPIIRTSDAETALRAVEAVCEGGIPCVEITMTVDRAIYALEKVALKYGDKVLLGAGTVLDPETARSCMLAGAEFFVTPNLNLRTIEIAKRYSKAVITGALTPTEVVTAWESGADAIKIFPCSAVGGAKYIKALRGPFPQIDFVPTGGVTLENIPDFFKAGSCAVGVGTELVDPKSIAANDYGIFTTRARHFRQAVEAAMTAAARS